VYGSLVAWAESSNRKPLLLRGARQVGKTYVARKVWIENQLNIELSPLLVHGTSITNTLWQIRYNEAVAYGVVDLSGRLDMSV
jgi:hypothetical protein